MTHVITQSCCSDASCVYACPANCIQPTPDDPAFTLAEMLHIDPAACVDCGACVDACPVDAIKPARLLSEAEQPFALLNADWFSGPGKGPRPLLAPVPAPLEVWRSGRPLRVAVVGSGPAGMYAADEVLTIPGATVEVFERLSRPYGLARFGVAPDHRRTRAVSKQLDAIAGSARLAMRCGVSVGTDLTHRELLARFDAVIYAVGAASDRRLEVPGSDLPGVASATQFVAWYNGHPDADGLEFDLSGERAVVIGNGNVALDVARILTVDPEALADTEIAPRALAALRGSRIREVVVAGRRGPAESAFTLPELIGLSGTPGVDLLVAAEDLAGERSASAKMTALRRLAAEGNAPRRIRLRYRHTPAQIVGEDGVRGVEFAGEAGVIDAGLVLTSIGYQGRPVADLPFDDASSTVPNVGGRVIDPATGAAVPRTYVAGWIKRGPTGFIGTNRSCAMETVRSLVDDHNAGRLSTAQLLRVA